jgi:IS5 family transposase
MGQLGFFDLSRRYECLDAKNDPLVAIASLVPWECFRPKLRAALINGERRTSETARKSPAGRKPWDEVVIFKALVLQALYNLSDDQTEYQLRDRLSFMRFLGLGIEDAFPDAKTLWLYREALAKAGAVEELFDLFDAHLKDKGFSRRGSSRADMTRRRPRARCVLLPRHRRGAKVDGWQSLAEKPSDQIIDLAA